MSISLKDKLIELIEKEDIKIEYTYAASFPVQGYFHYYLDRGNRVVPISINLPKLIDNDLHLALIMAHELGHYYFYKRMSSRVNKFITKTNNSFITYFVEKQAWAEAKNIIKNLNYWTDEVEYNFDVLRNNALETYKPKNILSSIMHHSLQLTKLWIVCYFIVSFFYLAVQNNIPIPFIPDNFVLGIERALFFNSINMLFILLAFLYVLARVSILITKRANTPNKF